MLLLTHANLCVNVHNSADLGVRIQSSVSRLRTCHQFSLVHLNPSSSCDAVRLLSRGQTETFNPLCKPLQQEGTAAKIVHSGQPTCLQEPNQVAQMHLQPRKSHPPPVKHPTTTTVKHPFLTTPLKGGIVTLELWHRSSTVDLHPHTAHVSATVKQGACCPWKAGRVQTHCLAQQRHTRPSLCRNFPTRTAVHRELQLLYKKHPQAPAHLTSYAVFGQIRSTH